MKNNRYISLTLILILCSISFMAMGCSGGTAPETDENFNCNDITEKNEQENDGLAHLYGNTIDNNGNKLAGSIIILYANPPEPFPAYGTVSNDKGAYGENWSYSIDENNSWPVDGIEPGVYVVLAINPQNQLWTAFRVELKAEVIEMDIIIDQAGKIDINNASQANMGRTILETVNFVHQEDIIETFIDKTGFVEMLHITFDSADSFAYELKWGEKGTETGQFSTPQAIATDSEGNIYVADYFNHRIQKFDSQGNFIKTWGKKGIQKEEFVGPSGIAVSEDGLVYVSDMMYRVQVFDTEGNYRGHWGNHGNGNGDFVEARGIAADSEGNVYVSDSGNNRVQKFTSEGRFISKFGTTGNGNGQFLKPFDLTVDSNDNVYVIDSYNHRVQKFDRRGNYLASWGRKGLNLGEFQIPRSIHVDDDDTVFVMDSYNFRVQRFDSNGNFIENWGRRGQGDGQFMAPYGICGDHDGNIYVLDTFNNRVQRFSE